ncbi:MAG TPA: hypothetical protein VF116_06345 [Ktedonobacterales bacterium]
MASDPAAVTKLYEQIPLEAMQNVADAYMAWYVDRVTRELDQIMAGLRTELRENDSKEASFAPSPSEIKAIERLQSSGVTGMDLLDRMVEQGEDWLMLTMRRLDHFERTGLAPKDYSTWCEHALSGAYDWIDHDKLGGGAPVGAGGGASRPAATSGGGASVPDWMSRGRPDEGPTAPVPSVASRQGWSESGGSYPGANAGAARQPANGQPAGQDDDGKGRNIFRIFTN